MKKLNIIFEITIRQRRKLSGAQSSEQKEEEEEEVNFSYEDVTPKQRPSSSSFILKKTRFSDVSNFYFTFMTNRNKNKKLFILNSF